MALYELDCADCGTPCHVARKDGKYCRSCSLLRVLQFAAKLPKQAPKCRGCGEKFRPLNRRDYSLCGSCTPHPAGPSETCAFCHQDAVQPYPGVAVCLPCLKSPPGRILAFTALSRGRAARKKANANTPRREMRRLDTPNSDTATPST